MELTGLGYTEREEEVCKRKVQFASKIDAKNKARQVAKQFGGPLQHAYECKRCRRWHLSSMPVEQARAYNRGEPIRRQPEIIHVQNYKSPPIARPLRYWITSIALSKFRGMLLPEEAMASDNALCEMLDEKIHKAQQSGKWSSVVDAERPNEDTQIAEIEVRGSKKFVVMRMHRMNSASGPSVVAGPNVAAFSAVTVLPSSFAAEAYSSGRWKASSPFAKLATVEVPSSTKPAADVPPPTRRMVIPVVAPVETAGPGPVTPVPTDSVRIKRGSITERQDYARSIFRERPTINIQGAGSLTELVEAKFGVGMSFTNAVKIRDEVIAELKDGRLDRLVKAEKKPARAPYARAPEPTLDELARTVAEVRGQTIPEGSLMTRLTKAVEVEKAARARIAKLNEELNEAEATARNASDAVDKLMAELTAARS